MKKPATDMPCMSIYTRMVNEDPSTTNQYDIERGETAYLSGTFTSSQLRVIANAMDELKGVEDIQASEEYYYANCNED